ncbi:hypothetical protein ABTL07_19605, partial [Acinetobacter baumannii]
MPQPPEAAGAALAVDDVLSDAGAEAAGVAAGAAASVVVAVPAADVPPEPPRKSVTYQPEPLSW